MKLLVNQVLDFEDESFPIGKNIKCRVTIFAEKKLDPVVVIFTELDDNPGASVTNASEAIANAVKVEFALDPRKTRWFEHYPGRGQNNKATYDEIFYQLNLGGQLTNASWKPFSLELLQNLTKSQVSELEF